LLSNKRILVFGTTWFTQCSSLQWSWHQRRKSSPIPCADFEQFKMKLRTQNHGRRNTKLLLLLVAVAILCEICIAESNDGVTHIKGGPDSVVWVVQLSDLHFSVHHPNRALDFAKFVGPALSLINPSLVLITGDLTGSSCLFHCLHCPPSKIQFLR